VCPWAEAHGIRVADEHPRADKAGEFDGVSATMNDQYSAAERAYYPVHALGSMVLWALDRSAVQAMFDELRDAKKDKESDPERLARAIERYRAFEIESSELAVWLLTELGHADAVASYTNFLRADLEALTEFHRRGKAPVWRDFFARWNDEVARGRRRVEPFRARAVPPFTTVRTEKQEALQRQQ
jgi:hypothetical protein